MCLSLLLQQGILMYFFMHYGVKKNSNQVNQAIKNNKKLHDSNRTTSSKSPLIRPQNNRNTASFCVEEGTEDTDDH